MRKFVFIGLLISCILSHSSCNYNRYNIKEALQEDVILSPLIYAEDSVILLVSTTSRNMIEELAKNSHIDNPKEYLYESIKSNSPISVSKEFYKEVSHCCIYADSTMNTIYEKEGVSGLIKKYTKGDNFVLYKSEQMLPLERTSSVQAYGENHNIEYIAYLLFKHHIYVTYNWVDESGILMISIAEKISDMNQLDVCL